MRVSAMLVAALLLLAVLVAGCGGSSGSGSGSGGSESSASSSESSGSGSTASSEESEEESGEEKPSGKPLSKKAMIKEGDAICGKIPASYNKKREELEKELKKSGKKPTKAEENLKAAVPPLFVAIEEFEKLTPPKGEEEKIEAIVAALGNAAKGLEEKPESELSGPKSPFNEFQELTKKYGFEFCSQL
jgi:hypothetical protein